MLETRPTPGDTAQQVEYIDSSKVTQINFVELRVTGSQTDSHQLAGSLLFHRNTVLNHFGWQTALRQFHTVLNLNSCQIRIADTSKVTVAEKPPELELFDSI